MINDIGFLQVKGVIFHSTVLKWWWRWDLSRMAMKMVMMMWSYCRQLPQVVILYFLRWHLMWWFLQWFEIGWQWRRWWSYCRQSWRDFRLDYTKFLGLQWPQLSMSWRLGEDCISSSPQPPSSSSLPPQSPASILLFNNPTTRFLADIWRPDTYFLHGRYISLSVPCSEANICLQ